jgi:hypothetical protein
MFPLYESYVPFPFQLSRFKFPCALFQKLRFTPAHQHERVTLARPLLLHCESICEYGSILPQLCCRLASASRLRHPGRGRDEGDSDANLPGRGPNILRVARRKVHCRRERPRPRPRLRLQPVQPASALAERAAPVATGYLGIAPPLPTPLLPTQPPP